MYRYRFDDTEWRTHVGITFKNFKRLLRKLKENDSLKPQRRSKDWQPLKKRLLCILVLLRSGCKQKTLDLLCGPGFSQSSVGIWRKKIVNALIELREFSGLYLETDPAKLKIIADGFESFGRSRVPNCVGAIDGTHIPVQHADLSFMNRKGFNSINVQVICDHEGRIRDICDERGPMPGSFSDKGVYLWSNARHWIRRLKTVGIRLFYGTPVAYWVAADGGYTMRPGCIVPFRMDHSGGNGGK